jgi:hypothetical protein
MASLPARSSSYLRKNDFLAEPVASGPEFQNPGSGGAVGAVAGDLFRKWRRRERRLLIRNPLRAIHSGGSLGRTAPGPDFLAAKQKLNRCDRTNRVVSAFCIPRSDTRVEHRVAQGKEHSRDICVRGPSIDCPLCPINGLPSNPMDVTVTGTDSFGALEAIVTLALICVSVGVPIML